MPEYSMAVSDGRRRVYMTTLVARDAREAMLRMAARIDPTATAADVEILELLPDGTAAAQMREALDRHATAEAGGA